MSTGATQFEQELRQRIAEELTRLRDELEAGIAVKDYADYKKYVGQIHSLKRVQGEFFDDVKEKLEKR